MYCDICLCVFFCYMSSISTLWRGPESRSFKHQKEILRYEDTRFRRMRYFLHAICIFEIMLCLFLHMRLITFVCFRIYADTCEICLRSRNSILGFGDVSCPKFEPWFCKCPAEAQVELCFVTSLVKLKVEPWFWKSSSQIFTYR